MENLLIALLAQITLLVRRFHTTLMRIRVDTAVFEEKMLRIRRKAHSRGSFTSCAQQSQTLSLSRRARRAARQRWFALSDVGFPKQMWVDRRATDWWDNFVLATGNDDEWILNFRMSRGTFDEIVSALRRRLERQATCMRLPILVEKRVAAAIWYLANTTYYRLVSQQFGLGMSTVGEIVLEFCFALKAELYNKVVCLGDEIGKSIEGFEKLGFPHCIGAVDSCRIPIRAPEGNAREYINRKDFCSVLLQGTVDHSGRFIDAEVSWSGRRHKAFVLQESRLRTAMDAGDFVPENPTVTIEGVQVPALILGDGAYPLRKWLMTPYKQPCTNMQSYYNLKHSCVRNVVKQAFGRLKGRWRCLTSRLHVHLDNVTPLIIACVILHNICEGKGHEITVPQEERQTMFVDEEPSITDQEKQRIYNEGIGVRDAIAKFIYTQRDESSCS